jgi:hypothetical protein
MGDWLTELNRPFNFSNIQGYPHDHFEKGIEKFPLSKETMLLQHLIIAKFSKG